MTRVGAAEPSAGTMAKMLLAVGAPFLLFTLQEGDPFAVVAPFGASAATAAAAGVDGG